MLWPSLRLDIAYGLVEMNVSKGQLGMTILFKRYAVLSHCVFNPAPPSVYAPSMAIPYIPRKLESGSPSIAIGTTS